MEQISLKRETTESPRFPAPPADEHTLAGVFGMQGALIKVERNVEIYGEEEPAEYLYQVLTGAVRTYKVLQDGRRQIGAFHLAGDVFGLEAGEAAASAGARKLLLTHLMPFHDPMAMLAEAKEAYDGELELAHVGTTYQI